MNQPITTPDVLNLKITVPELDLIAHRLTAGQMDFNTAKAVDFVLQKLQAQANDQTLNPRPAQEKKL